MITNVFLNGDCQWSRAGLQGSGYAPGPYRRLHMKLSCLAASASAESVGRALLITLPAGLLPAAPTNSSNSSSSMEFPRCCGSQGDAATRGTLVPRLAPRGSCVALRLQGPAPRRPCQSVRQAADCACSDRPSAESGPSRASADFKTVKWIYLRKTGETATYH